ncbi:MAG: hypothetical protein DRN37_00785 [Thermoplasmata archaeon]|nr:MAG: hypothetical protein DRN37_00785 [Thermoplasmata archaeon]HHD16743.1 hypothetical protein [Euryarchaeota archaeon]
MRSFVILLLGLVLLAAGALSASANPIPGELIDENGGGASPSPAEGPSTMGNLSVYLSEETIRATLGLSSADVEAGYLFRNTAGEDVSVGIILPFWDDFSEVEIEAGGNEIHYSRTTFMYTSQEHNSGDVEFLEGVSFTIVVPGMSRVAVNVSYTGKVNVYDTDLNNEILYWFSYLVGSAVYWNHSIDHAYFEYRLPGKYYSRMGDIGSDWEVEKKGSMMVFTIEHRNWTPTKDLITLGWERDRPFLDRMFFNFTLGQILLAALALIIVVLLAVLSIRFVRKKRKRSDKVK